MRYGENLSDHPSRFRLTRRVATIRRETECEFFWD
jgi:hypothetical protein